VTAILTKGDMEMKEKGELALKYISGYPLYASTSNITYNQAILVAEALNPDWQAELQEIDK